MIAGYVKKNHPVSKMAIDIGFSVEVNVNSEIRLTIKKSFKSENSVSEIAISETNFLIGYAKDMDCGVPVLSVQAANGASDVVFTVLVPMDWYWGRVTNHINERDSFPEIIPANEKNQFEFGYVPGR